ncbi:FN3 associated domain-containing protein [Chryseobacterium indoltheticum]|uniref:FN3 associated domain-containing protein n=1 Tax=Chryseobacterium indoltheticum TaxID=254 RepID=UPI003F499A2F
MKNSIFYFYTFICILFSQIYMSPTTHYYNSYQMTIQGNGTIYYTEDGTTPTLSSSSAVNSVNILIDQNKEIKAFW